MVAISDLQFKIVQIEEVKEIKKDGVIEGWEIKQEDGWIAWCPNNGVVPKVGDMAKFYGKGIGYPNRGLFINEQKVYYETEQEQQERFKQENIQRDKEKIKEFRKNRSKLDARFNALPKPFQERINKFRRNNSKFRWKLEPYELFCCEEALKIAKIAKQKENPEKWIEVFKEYSWDEQVKIGIDEGHSSNTFGCACALALLYLSQPNDLKNAWGALAPLVGSKEYGG